MGYNPNSQHFYKPMTRKAVWDMLPKGTVAKKILFLTTVGCLDLKMGLELGKIDSSTIVHCFESKDEYAKLIKEFLSQNFKNWKLYPETLEKHFSYYKMEEYDLIYFDFCGAINYDIFSLLRDNKKNLRKTALAFTFGLNSRGSCFYNDYKYEKIIADKCIPYYPGNSRFYYEGKCFKNLDWTIYQIFDALGFGGKTIKTNRIENLITYKEKDSNFPMVFFTINFRKYHLAAKKAWETQRAQAV